MPLTGQQLTVKQRQDIESRLANYNIPFQILQMVAERCECANDIANAGRVDASRQRSSRAKMSTLLSSLNDDSIVLLQQIFLDCHDSLSDYRFAAFLSSKYTPFSYKFVMDQKVVGKSGTTYNFDICIYNRHTEEMTIVGLQNKDPDHKAQDSKSLRKFLAIIEDVYAAYPSMQSAYYSSSYGYDVSNAADIAKSNKIGNDSGGKVEVKFLEYKDTIYFENKSLSK